MKLKRLTGGGFAIAALIGSMLFGHSAAVADEPDDSAQYVRVEMTGVPVTAKNAVKFGYEVRTDADGTKYAVAPGTAEGDFSRAVKIVPEPKPGQITPYNTVYGSCGYSWFFFDGPLTYDTGYQIYTSYGYSINYGWTTTFKSSIDLHTNSFGSPFATQRWSLDNQPHGAQALRGSTMSGFASGNVLTTGGICYSGGPTDTVKW